MNIKKGNTILPVIAGVLIILVIILMIIYFSLDGSENVNKKNNNSNADTSKNTTETSAGKDETTTKVDDENEVEEVKKIDESKDKVYEKEISVNDRTYKAPVINYTTKAATRINSEIENKYIDAIKNGNYIVYSYYMYVGMISLILDYNYSSGANAYEVYNINSDTGKQMTNEDLCEKLKISSGDFLNKAKDAYKSTFEELYKDIDKNSNSYTKSLEATLKSADDAINAPMYINLEGQFAIYAKITSATSGLEEYHLVEFK
ncbi:MAG: hypothetical protein IJ809_06255 [Clostridia bacterium]|nr:hypothetical protein [Clostridia bacterium]